MRYLQKRKVEITRETADSVLGAIERDDLPELERLLERAKRMNLTRVHGTKGLRHLQKRKAELSRETGEAVLRAIERDDLPEVERLLDKAKSMGLTRVHGKKALAYVQKRKAESAAHPATVRKGDSFSRADADGNGALDMAEFATLMRATKQPTPSTAGGRTSPANKPRRPGARRQAQV